MVSAGLASCTAITLRMYARHKGLKLEQISVDVSHEKVHAQDCEDCKRVPKVDVFTRKISLEGELSEEQRQRMLQIANRCPVHNTLHAEARVESELQD